MIARVFVDANVLVYSRDDRDLAKKDACLEWLDLLWADRRGSTSIQALSEFYATVTRKWRPPVAPEVARADVRRYMSWRPSSLDSELVEDAWHLQDRFQLAWWDATIVAAAKSSGSRFLLTEDLQDGQDFSGVVVVNPFNRRPQDL